MFLRWWFQIASVPMYLQLAESVLTTRPESSFRDEDVNVRSRQLDVEFDSDGAFVVTVHSERWLSQSPLRAFIEGSWHEVNVGPEPIIRKGLNGYKGSDDVGTFICLNVSWTVTTKSTIPLHTSVKIYDDGKTVVFIHELPEGAEGTNASNPILPTGHDKNAGMYPPIVNFPSFRDDDRIASLGSLVWHDCMSGLSFGTNVTSFLNGLSSNGPVALFDASYRTLVISPLDNFKNAVHTLRNSASPAWETGVSSEVISLPRGFVHRTIVVLGSGVTSAMAEWGSLLRRIHGTRRSNEEDPVVNYLSYWTDNGAYYYGDQWNQAGGGGDVCNETAMVAVADGLKQQDLLDAVHIWQLDDWWYPGHPSIWVHCVENWTLSKPFFQDNLSDLQKKLQTPWLLYIPFWCAENIYSTKYKFIQGSSGETQFSVPHPDDALDFYRMVFDYGVSHGMRGFEHDFLNFNFLAVPHFRKHLGSSETWLAAIDTSARERGIPVQMCMSLPSDLMASVKLNSVSNYRASGDYASDDNWLIAGSSLLAFALDLRPSKDNFWTHRPTSAVETGKPWDVHSNPGSNCELNTIVATLSTGPVGIGDKAGETNKTLLMRSIRSDGLILQPDKPATPIDFMYMQETNLSHRPRFAGQVWSSHAAVSGNDGNNLLWHYIFTVDVLEQWQLSDTDLYPVMQASAGWVVHRWHTGHTPTACLHTARAVDSGCLFSKPIREVSSMPFVLNDRPIMVQNDTHVFDLLQFAPIFKNGWVLLGETEKYVSVGSKRFKQVNLVEDGFTVVAKGVPGEVISITALDPVRSSSSSIQTEEWTVVVKTITFIGSEAVVNFQGGSSKVGTFI